MFSFYETAATFNLAIIDHWHVKYSDCSQIFPSPTRIIIRLRRSGVFISDTKSLKWETAVDWRFWKPICRKTLFLCYTRSPPSSSFRILRLSSPPHCLFSLCFILFLLFVYSLLPSLQFNPIPFSPPLFNPFSSLFNPSLSTLLSP